MKQRILVIGSLNMDMVITMKHMPVVGETVLGNDLSLIHGGKGANQACAIGNLGGNVTMLGCVGQDNFGDMLVQNLAERHVDVSHMKRQPGTASGTAVIYVDEQGNNSIAVVAGANHHCDVDYLSHKLPLFEQADYILLQMEIPFDAIEYAVTKGHEMGKTIVLNPAPAPDSLPDSLLSQLDCITPNETELAKLTGIPSDSMQGIEQGAAQLLARGVKRVIVTLGDKGCFYMDAHGSQLVPTRKVKAVDTTAAGDCFNGAFIVALAEKMTDAQALGFANTASSISVTRKGAQQSLPVREEVDIILAGQG